jgi:hypothetical protein
MVQSGDGPVTPRICGDGGVWTRISIKPLSFASVTVLGSSSGGISRLSMMWMTPVSSPE